MPPMIWNRKKSHFPKDMEVGPKPFISGHQFTLKGSPRHFYDVKTIIEDGGGQVYFGEPLAYERGAAIALWRVRANDLGWLDRLYDWWVEAERTEPVAFTFHLYLPSEPKYPAMNLRDHTPAEVAEFIRQNAPEENTTPYTGISARGPVPGVKIP